MAEPQYDLLIQGGRILDGTGSPWRRADLAVADGEIAALGLNLPESSAREVLSAEGRYVAPGFVDAHSHADLTQLSGERMEYRLAQGITTEVVGQDGLSYAPASGAHLEEWKRYLVGLNGAFPDRIAWDWETTGQLLDRYESRASNTVFLIPHGAVRVEVMGWEARPADQDELARMQDLVRQGLAEGGAGLSTGLTYMPCAHADTEEMIALCEPVGQAGGILSVHLRSYAGQLLEAVGEAIEIGEATGAGIHISHLRMADRSTWDMAERVLTKIDRARERGVDVTFDIYPYTVGCAPLFCLLPPWAQHGGPDAVLARLADPDQRELIRTEHESWGLDWGLYSLSNAAAPAYQGYEGRPLPEAARAEGVSVPELIMDVLLDTALDATITAEGGREHANRIMLQHPAGMIGSDGVLVGGRPHPRGFGTYPRLLARYVRDNRLLRLEEAVWKMSAFPARRHRLENRGVLTPGAPADVVVFSLADLEDRATYECALQRPRGIDTVLVNGEPVVRDGEYRGGTSGRALRPLAAGTSRPAKRSQR